MLLKLHCAFICFIPEARGRMVVSRILAEVINIGNLLIPQSIQKKGQVSLSLDIILSSFILIQFYPL